MHLASVLAVAYLLVIGYASLQPFSGWWTPPDEIRRFLYAPWPRFITVEDILFNIAAYVPLGFLLARALLRSLGPRRGVLLAVVATALISLAMEAVQMFMPTRIASNVDLLTNSIGGLIGALGAPLFSPTRLLGLRLARWRRAWFVYGPIADVGLVLLCLWLLTQLNPTAQLFGTGFLRATFALPAPITHTPYLLLTAEAAVAAFNVLGLGLLAIALTRASMPRGAALAGILLLACSAKVFAGLAFPKGAEPLAWLTPGVALGMLLAAVLLYTAVRLPRRLQWLLAALSFIAAIIAINIAPDNPYQTVPPQLLIGPTHFLSVSEIVRALSELWPFLAVVYALAAAFESPLA